MEYTKLPTDWEAIERHYRANVLSIREIAKQQDVSEGAVRKKAKAKGWERDLSAKVAEKVRSELVREEVRTANPQTEREIVDVAAATVVHVVRSHRSRIKQGNALVELLTNQLIDVAGKREEFEATIEEVCENDKTGERRTRLMKAVSLGSHATIAGNLASATKTWIGLERQAFGLANEEPPPTPPGPGADKVLKSVAESAVESLSDAIRARLVKDAELTNGSQFHTQTQDN